MGDATVLALCQRYIERLSLPTDSLWLTDDRSLYSQWLGRRIPSHYGGAYCFLSRQGVHAVLINTPKINTDAPRSLEIVVCEELVHMRDALDGDHRRHSHHGHDRIAHRVAEMTGATLEEVRTCLRPTARREPRYVYGCPACGMTVTRRVRGTWSCGRCSPVFAKKYVLKLLVDRKAEAASAS